MVNQGLKWFGFCVIGAAMPIIVRLIICLSPFELDIDLFCISDLVFYGIALHISLGHELLKFSDCGLTTFIKVISGILCVFYIIFSVLTILFNSHNDMDLKKFNFLIFFVLFSAGFCTVCGIWGNAVIERMKKND